MNSWVFAALVGGGIYVVSAAGACSAERQIKVINGSSQTIIALYASPPDLDAYGVNLLGSVKVQAGQSATLTFEGNGACAFDFQAVTGDEDMFTVRNVDVCAALEVRIPQ